MIGLHPIRDSSILSGATAEKLFVYYVNVALFLVLRILVGKY